MPNDALNYKFLTEELNRAITGGRIERVNMPSKDRVTLVMRARGETLTLMLDAGGGAACYLTKRKFTGLERPPAFLTHLRKYIAGAVVEEVIQLPFERVLFFKLDCRNELNIHSEKQLVIEIMGRYANILLIADGKISECLKHLSGDVSERILLPSVPYAPPAKQNKLAPLERDAIAEKLMGLDLIKALPATVYGLAASSFSEALYGIEGKDGIAGADALIKLYERPFSPCVLKAEGKIKDFFFTPYQSQKGEYVCFDTLSEAMDVCFAAKQPESGESDAFKKLKTEVKNAVKRTEKRLAGFYAKRLEGENAETERLFGELITANIYRLKSGEKSAELDNYYDGTKVTIPLDPQKTPQANAQAYFKKYAKKKKTLAALDKFIPEAERELETLESVGEAFKLCRGEEDLEDLRRELEEIGVKDKAPARRRVKTVSLPLKFEIDGFTVLVGKNNVQNDRVTRQAAEDDVWLHAQKIRGSHVIIRSEGKKVPESVVEEAAKLAAHYSKAAASENVPVDYTAVKFVSKPTGAPAGRVIYANQKTLYVNPAPN